MPTIGQAIAWNESFWTRHLPRYYGSKWVEKHGWGGEDWNFDRAGAVRGVVYGYGQGKPAKGRVEEAKGVFDVLFYSRRPTDSEWVIVGAYQQARYLDYDEAYELWSTGALKALRKERMRQVKASLGKKEGAKEAKLLDEGAPIRWEVAVENIIEIRPSPIYRDCPGPRHTNAHKLAESLSAILGTAAGLAVDDDLGADSDSGTHEGQRVLREHVVWERYRDRDLVARFRAERLKTRTWRCDRCGSSHQEQYGDAHASCFDVHHTKLISTMGDKGGKTTLKDLRLLCANCHRVEHWHIRNGTDFKL